MPRSRGQSIKQLSRACAAHLSLTLPGPSAAHSKLIGSRHRIANPQPTNPPNRFPNSTQAGWQGEGGGGGGGGSTNVILHFPTIATHLYISVRFGIGLHRSRSAECRGGTWDGAAEEENGESKSPLGRKVRLLGSAPSLPQSLTGLLKCVLQRQAVRWWGVEEGIISRSCLRDWNPQRLSSRHMVRSIPSTAPAPVTLRLRCPTHPPPSTLALSGGGQCLCLAHPLPFTSFPGISFSPLVFSSFSPKNILSFAFTPPSSTFFLSCTEKKPWRSRL